MNFEQWIQGVPGAITSDSIWKMTAYRLALFLGDLAWHDVTKLCQDRRTLGLSDQLYRAVGSISANLTEGYSRGTGKDRARFYEYSLGSAREARDWYFKGRHILGAAVVEHRFQLVAEVIRLTLAMIPDQRGYVLKEDEPPYRAEPILQEHPDLDSLLNNVPIPAE